MFHIFLTYFQSNWMHFYKVFLLISVARRFVATPILGRFIRASSLKRVNFPILHIWSAAQRDREGTIHIRLCAKWVNVDMSSESTKLKLQLSILTITFYAWGRRNQMSWQKTVCNRPYKLHRMRRQLPIRQTLTFTFFFTFWESKWNWKF